MDYVSVKSRYLEKIKLQQLEENESQEKLIKKLDSLKEILENSGFFQRGSKFLHTVVNFKKLSNAKGLYIHGGVGVGKSMLMDIFFEIIKVKRKRRIHFHEFMNEVQENIDIARKKKKSDPIKEVALQIIRENELICLDEIQINDVADAMIVGRLFEHFFKKKLVIVTTSNRAPRDLYKDGLNRQLFLPFIDLINKNMDIENMESGKDFRRSKLSGAKKYFISSSNKDSDQFYALANSFDISFGEGLRVQVKGRELFFSKFHNGVALLDFSEICSVPLGSLDYQQIISHFRLFFLDKIPQLSKEGNDSAKRFITLIDTVYEKRIEFICKAETTPDLLYLSGKNNFEFQRTISRLYEIQSSAWPGK